MQVGIISKRWEPLKIIWPMKKEKKTKLIEDWPRNEWKKKLRVKGTKSLNSFLGHKMATEHRCICQGLFTLRKSNHKSGTSQHSWQIQELQPHPIIRMKSLRIRKVIWPWSQSSTGTQSTEYFHHTKLPSLDWGMLASSQSGQQWG